MSNTDIQSAIERARAVRNSFSLLFAQKNIVVYFELKFLGRCQALTGDTVFRRFAIAKTLSRFR